MFEQLRLPFEEENKKEKKESEKKIEKEKEIEKEENVEEKEKNIEEKKEIRHVLEHKISHESTNINEKLGGIFINFLVEKPEGVEVEVHCIYSKEGDEIKVKVKKNIKRAPPGSRAYYSKEAYYEISYLPDVVYQEVVDWAEEIFNNIPAKDKDKIFQQKEVSSRKIKTKKDFRSKK